MLMSPVMLLFLLGPTLLTGIFDTGIDTATLAGICLMIGACEVPFLMVTESLTGTLRGAGANLPVMWVTAIGSWGFRVPLSWWLAFGGAGVPAMGLKGVWVATVFDWIVRSAILATIVRRGGWLQTKV